MALVHYRNSEDLKNGFALWLADHFDVTEVEVSEPDFPSAGYSSETAIFEVSWKKNNELSSSSWVVRMPPSTESTFHDYSLTAQQESMELAATVDLPLPHPFITETNPKWLGGEFMVMKKIEGHIIGQVAALDPWATSLTEETQRTLSVDLMNHIARIHSTDISVKPSHIPQRNDAEELDYWKNYLTWAFEGNPDQILLDAHQWCVKNKPNTQPEPVLLWGDVRYGNIIYNDDNRADAILDWDMSTIGSPEHDLAWFLINETVTAEVLQMNVPGFINNKEYVAYYEEKSGRKLSSLAWYETFALFKSSAILARIGFLELKAGKEPMFPTPDDNPLYTILKKRID